MPTDTTYIPFSVQTVHGEYRDALAFPAGRPLPDAEGLEAMKAERVANWLSVVTQEEVPPDGDTDG